MEKFEVGDRIRRRQGKRIAEYVGDNRVRWEHNQQEQYMTSRELIKFILVGEDDAVPAKDALYEVNIPGEGTVVCVKLMERTKTSWLMEEKGGSRRIITSNKNEITEIVPYTIDVYISNFNGNSGGIGSYFAEESKYNVNDIYLMGKTLGLARVVKLDSKSKNAKGDFKPMAKLHVEYLGF